MKKILSTMFIGAAIILGFASKVLAENFTYKVYNPKLNKAYTAVLGTISLTDTQYIWGFYEPDGRALCVINLNTNKDSQGLIGSQCTDIGAFMKFMNGDHSVNLSDKKHELGWREKSTDTFYREMESIRRERAAQGKYEYQPKF